MKAGSGFVRLSASDLSNHLPCHHLTSLDLAVAIGARPAPAWRSPDAEVLQGRGMAHEDAYLKHLEAQCPFSICGILRTPASQSGKAHRPGAVHELFLSEHAHRGCGEGAEGAQH